ncbi:hypothetical protein E6Q11_03190 [Candidatus Dojkabacteria bacterium]|uniref:Uncharacterized protein n=1 Tax=Candidatus Dojkabacteria bacterium TaxID=2099670 RepID=A0A5C7J6P9_9BACT|nr:MAG: hypothetical protein E6Q11_03190 [Candidatus Dojkabacteria bacterium]
MANAFTTSGATQNGLLNKTSTPTSTVSSLLVPKQNVGVSVNTAPKPSVGVTPAPKPSVGVSTGVMSTPKTPVITEVDNVNKTYRSDGQLFKLNPATGRFEASVEQSMAQPTQTYTPTTMSQPTGITSGLIPTPPTPQTPAIPTAPQTDTTFAGLLRQIVEKGGMSEQERLLKEQQAAQRADIARSIGLEQMTPGTNVYQTGRTGIIQNIGNAQLQALAEQEKAFAAQRETQLSALQNAATLAAPQLASFSQQAFNPQTGTFSAGTSMNDAVSNMVQRLQNGTISYDAAVQALSGYGQGGVNALQQALPPTFNIAQSNALAGQQGIVTPTVQTASLTLNSLQKALENLVIPGQTSSFVPLNVLTNAASNFLGFGKESTAQVQGLVAEARSALQAALASSKGGTPTDYVGQSYQMLPDNPSIENVKAAINVLNSLGGIRQSVYGNPGQVGNQPTQTTTPNNLFSW